MTPAEIGQRFVRELGSPEWRVTLFRGWELLRGTVNQVVPTASWWLWGCFVSNHLEPLFGTREVLSAVVLLPVLDLPSVEQGGMLLEWLQAAEQSHRVDVATVFQFPYGHEAYPETLEALEMKWRPRAVLGVPNHQTREKEPAAFLEVGP